MAHPIHEGNEVAQQIYDRPQQTPWLLKHLGHKTLSYYRDNGMLEQNRKKATLLAVRNVWRACLAPILHGIEVELGSQVSRKLQAGQPLTLPEGARTSHLDRIFGTYGQHSGKKLEFLYASGWLSMEASKKFLGQVVNDPQHWCAPILDDYRHAHADYKAATDEHKTFIAYTHLIPYIWQIVAASNITTLSVIVPAAAHASLWPGSADNPKAALLDRVNELGWPQTVNRHTFEANFPEQSIGSKPPETCPFTHDEGDIATGSIWNLASLREGPWRMERYCPANVPLRSPNGQHAKISAATMRLGTAIHIADQVWSN